MKLDVGLLVLLAAVALGIYTLYMNKPSQALFEPDPDYGN